MFRLSDNKFDVSYTKTAAKQVQKKQNSNYHYVTLNESKINPEYWQLVNEMYREQAARILQRFYRKKFKVKYCGKYVETLNGPLTLKFLKEPYETTKAIEYAALINAGKWVVLPFNDPEYERNLFKATRLNLISVSRMSTAKLLYDATVQFKHDYIGVPQIEQKDISKDGSFGNLWSPKSISYISQEKLQNLHERLEKIDAADKKLFIVNFTNKLEIAFLWHWVNQNNLFVSHEPFRQLMINFINYRIVWTDKNEVKQLKYALKRNVKNFSIKTNALKQYCLDAISKNLLNNEDASITLKIALLFKRPQLVDWVEAKGFGKNKLIHNRDKDRESIVLLYALAKVFDEEGPFFCLSPHFKPQHLETPLISILIPTDAYMNALVDVLYGQENAIRSFYTVGQVTTRLIAKLEDKQLRPVELSHPDLIASQFPHDCYSHNFTLSWHDSVFHRMRNSKNSLKPLIRYIKNLFINEKQVSMSKLIWTCSDLDHNFEFLSLLVALNNRDVEQIKLQKAFQLIMLFQQLFGKSIWTNPMQHNVLLLIIDMINNKDSWTQLLGQAPIEALHAAASLVKTSPQNKNVRFAIFFAMFDVVNKMILRAPQRSAMFYILYLQLCISKNNGYTDRGITLSRFLSDKILSILLEWDKNNGLQIRKIFIPASENKSIENVFHSELVCKLLKALYRAYDLGVKEVFHLLQSHDFKSVSVEDKKSEFIYSCIKHNDQSLLAILRDHNYVLNQKRAKGMTPFLYAAFHGHVGVMKQLYHSLNGQINPNAALTTGVTALHIAAIKGNVDVAIYLLELGASVTQEAYSKYNAIQYAIYNSEVVLKVLLHFYGKQLKQDPKLDLYFSTAALQNNLSLLQLLTAVGNDISAINLKTSPLHTASYYGHYNVVKSFVKSGAAIFSPNKQGHTALTYALIGESKEIIEYFLKKKSVFKKLSVLDRDLLQAYQRKLKFGEAAVSEVLDPVLPSAVIDLVNSYGLFNVKQNSTLTSGLKSNHRKQTICIC